MSDRIQPGYVGPARANGRDVLVTKAGLCIGLLHEPPKPQPTSAEEFTMGVLMHRRPLAWDQLFVTALCTLERRK
jgi:hypothetical protein